MGLEPIIHYDTAGAARDLAANPELGTAAIARNSDAECDQQRGQQGVDALAHDVTLHSLSLDEPSADSAATSLFKKAAIIGGAAWATQNITGIRQVRAFRKEYGEFWPSGSLA
jgi:peptidoglycan/xylan/chitin deacetylase (PgdA/CDA1 family)